MKPLLLSLLLLFIFGPAVAQVAGYGTTDFPNSGSTEAQPAFIKGLLMLHSFEYDDAREAFEEARRIDPDFAMAYWGEAMTCNHPLWAEQDLDGARAVLADLGATPEARMKKAPTDREKGYLAAIEALYGDGDRVARDAAYEQAMGRLSDAFPDDLDAAAFHALSILGTAHEGRDFATYMRAAAIAEEVFAKNPNHPGAAHYLIHSYDDPIHAPLGLRAARVYARIAPSAAHALHMPSHIFFALGMWEEGSASNEDSYAAAKAWSDRHGVVLNGAGFHAQSWLIYSYVEQGRYADARHVLDLAQATYGAMQNGRSAFHLTLLWATYLLDTEDWSRADALPRLASMAEAPMLHYAAGIIALKMDDRDAATTHLAALNALAEDAGNAMTQIMRLQLDGLLHLDAGEAEAGLSMLEEAATKQDALPLDYGPPQPIKPSHEVLGEALAALGHHAEAQAQFEESLTRTPRRTQSLLGLARAAAHQGDTQAVAEAKATLRHIWQHADAPLLATLDGFSP